MTWLVARRELRQRGRSRAFAISTIVLMVAVALAVALPAILSGHAKPQRVGIVGGNQATATKIVQEAARITGTKVTVVAEPDVPAAETGMRSGNMRVALVIGSEVISKQISVGE